MKLQSQYLLSRQWRDGAVQVDPSGNEKLGQSPFKRLKPLGFNPQPLVRDPESHQPDERQKA